MWQLWKVGVVWGRVYYRDPCTHEMAVEVSQSHQCGSLVPSPKERRGLGARLPSAADEACYWLKLTLVTAFLIVHKGQISYVL